MTELAKATLTELNASNATVGEAVAVQFNPATLRMQLTNRSAGGAQAGAQTRQQAGEASATMSFDLQFDTADEGTAEAPVSVLRKTAAVERFVRPRGNQPGQEAPPRVQFEWGSVKLQGVMESLSLDLDLFAFDGTPLRARCAVSIKGQDAAYRYAPQGAGAGTGDGARGGAPAGSGGGAVAAALAGIGNLSGLGQAALAGFGAVTRALNGESLPQLAARTGRDPAGWRDLAAGGANPQQLPAGQPVALPPAGQGGIAEAVQSGALGQGIGNALQQLTQGPPGNVGAAQKAVTRGGGIDASQTQQRREAHDGQAQRALSGFGPAAAGAPSAAGRATAEATPRQTTAVAAAPADDRPYGFGLPLKPRRAVADAAASASPSRARLRSRCRGACGGACGCSH